MIERDTIEQDIKYCKELILARKTRNEVASQFAVLYRDTRDEEGATLQQSYTLAASETKLTRLTYSHPGAETPYCQLQFTLTNVDVGINYEEYREPQNLANPEVTEWIMSLTNLATSTDTFTVNYGVKSSAPGTLSLVVL